jgi:hypothetical protein
MTLLQFLAFIWNRLPALHAWLWAIKASKISLLKVVAVGSGCVKRETRAAFFIHRQDFASMSLAKRRETTHFKRVHIFAQRSVDYGDDELRMGSGQKLSTTGENSQQQARTYT